MKDPTLQSHSVASRILLNMDTGRGIVSPIVAVTVLWMVTVW